ncbi:hypothetical protein EV368DRAFT_88846 [Lentinula lateritia]|nr:hypothetical protein EV368DRAFT_88846 [Lentinula lateritia]
MSTLQLTETQALALQALLYREKQLPPALQEVLAALPPSTRDIETGVHLSPETYTRRKEIEPTKFTPTTPTPTSMLTLPSTSASLSAFESPSAFPSTSTSTSTSISTSTSDSISVPTSASTSAPTFVSMLVPMSVSTSVSASVPTSVSTSAPVSTSVTVSALASTTSLVSPTSPLSPLTFPSTSAFPSPTMSASTLLTSGPTAPCTHCTHCGFSTYPSSGPRIPGQRTAPEYGEASVDTEEVRIETRLSSPSSFHPVAPQDLNPPLRKRKRRAGTSGGGQEDPAPISCPRKSVRTKKRARNTAYDSVQEVVNRFSINDTPAEPSKDITADMTTELGRISLGTQTSVGSTEYLSWVADLKSMMEGTLNNVRDMAVSSLVSIARCCDLATKVDGTARFVRMLNELYFAAKVNSQLNLMKIKENSLRPRPTAIFQTLQNHDIPIQKSREFLLAGSRWAFLANSGTSKPSLYDLS